MTERTTLTTHSRLQIIPAKYANFVMPVLLSVFMTFIVSLISTLRSTGINEHTLHVWMSSWGMSWIIAFPTLLVALPLVKKITQALVKPV